MTAGAATAAGLHARPRRHPVDDPGRFETPQTRQARLVWETLDAGTDALTLEEHRPGSGWVVTDRVLRDRGAAQVLHEDAEDHLRSRYGLTAADSPVTDVREPANASHRRSEELW